MSKINYYVTDKRAIWDHHGKNEEDVQNHLDHVKKWCDEQVHIEETPCDTTIHHFLTNCKYDVEKTKKVLDVYHSKWALMPEICEHYHPFHENMSETYKAITVVPLPRLSSQLRRIMILRFNKVSHEHFDLHKSIAQLYLHLNEVRVLEDHSTGDEYIFDYKHIDKYVVDKFTIKDVRKIEFILKEMYGRDVKAFHIINYSPVAETLVTMLRTTFVSDLKNRIFVHENLEDLYKHVSRDILPEEYGGDEESLDELSKKWIANLEHHTELFDKLHGETERCRPAASGEFDVCKHFEKHLTCSDD